MKNFVKAVRSNLPEQIAKEICSVQPIDSCAIKHAIKQLYEASKSKDELVEEGYQPVSNLGLMWIKKDD